MGTIAVVAHSGKTLGGGLNELRDELAVAGAVDPLWFEVPKSKMAPKRVREALESTRGEDVVVLDAALLGAWNLAEELDGVVIVEAPVEIRLARLEAARGFPEAEARLRIEGQRLPPVRGARRTWRILNGGSRAALLRRADEVWGEIERLRSEAPRG